MTTTEPNPDAPVEDAAPQEPLDTRQRWYCVDVYGPRSTMPDPLGGPTSVFHPEFRSDAHLDPMGKVVCPACGGTSVQRAELWEQGQVPRPTAPRAVL